MAMVGGSVENRNVVRVGLKYSSKADNEDESLGQSYTVSVMQVV